MKTFVCREMVSVMMFAFIVFTMVVANLDKHKSVEQARADVQEVAVAE